jgi:3-hydroxyisobutyrate dehydrogenase-like beta-hydroxyacid dehydrogenase
MSDQTETSRSVSVIGLGAMGSGIARTLIDSGCRVSVWNRSRDKVDQLVSLGAAPCSDPKEALEASAFTVVCLASYSAWMQIIEDHQLQTRFNGTCIIQLTGGNIEEVEDHAAFIEKQGGRIADGAVMCFPRQLGTEAASLLVAGPAEILTDCDPFLQMLAPTWTNLGEDIKQPSVMSRALTAGFIASLVGFVNGVAICQAGGISLDFYMEHVDKANAFLPAEKRRLIEAIRDDETEVTQASMKTWAEGHQTVHSVAGTLGTQLLLQDTLKEVFAKGLQMGLGEHDLAALVKVFAPDR